MNRDELIDLIPAYALGALDADEKAEFETWLVGDSQAQALLAEYRQVADRLVIAAPLRTAPPHLQADLRRRLAATRTQARSRFRRLAWVGAAAALVALVLLGVMIPRIGEKGDQADADARLFEDIAAQEGANWIPVEAGEVDPAVSGELVVSPAGDQAVIRLTYLPTIQSDQTFQLWLVDQEGTRLNGGLFRASRADEPTYVRVPLDQPITMYQRMGVSLEPAGGSPYADRPTGPRVFSILLSE